MIRNSLIVREPMTRFELVTSSLPRKRSTPELHRQKRAGDRVRTGDIQLGRLTLYQLSYSRLITDAKISKLFQYFKHTCGESRIRTCEGRCLLVEMLNTLRRCSSGVERFLGKEEVTSSNLVIGSFF